MRKVILSLSMIFLLCFFLSACGDKPLSINDIDIEAIDRVDVPVGTYTIQYSIDDLSNLVKNHGAIISFEVKDSSNQEITVTGNTFTVLANEIYTVKIKLTLGDTFKEKEITVTAIKLTSPVLITFVLNGGNGSFPALTIDYGSKLNMTSEPTKDGFTFEGWYFEEVYTTRYINQVITSNIFLYAKWEPVVIQTATITFDLQSGTGSYPDQMVQYGDYSTRPNVNPTKEGYVFSGWYTQISGGEPFNFEAHTVYSDLTIYAQWTIINTHTKTVTYDLNGAFQSEPITEEVESGQSPKGPSAEFIYAGHLFQGWSTTNLSEVPDDLSGIIILDNLTLYAVWHIDFEVIEGETYMQDHQYVNRSTLNEGYVEQRYQIQTFMHIKAAENDFSITEDRVDYGIIYSSFVTSPTYYSENSMRIAKPFSGFDESITIPSIELLTEPLLSDTTYYIVTYARFEETIIYSDVIILKTSIQVPEGTAVGANYILSGGYYKIDSNTTAFRPSTFIEILDGFEARLDDLVYSSFSQLYKQGIRRLVTKEISTGKEYLHVFDLDFQTPHVTITLSSHTDANLDVMPIYDIVFPFEEFINYPISELGVLYSKTHPFLKLDIPGVHKKAASLLPGESSFTTDSAIDSSGDVIYVRGYAMINKKVSYSRYITKLVYNNGTSLYENLETIDTTMLKTTEEFGTSANYTPVTKRVYKVTGDEITYQDYPNQYTLTENGQYFVRNSDGTGMIDDILIIDDYPDVSGVIELGQYINSVFITFDMYNPDWYYALNDGEYVNLPAQIRISVPGFYELYYRTGTGIEVLHFEIVTEKTE